jgi:hypothetical protein
MIYAALWITSLVRCNGRSIPALRAVILAQSSDVLGGEGFLNFVVDKNQ